MPREREEAAREALRDAASRPTPSDAESMRQWSADIREKQDGLREALADWEQ